MLGDQAFPAADIGLVRSKRFTHLALGQPRLGLTGTMQPAEQQDEQPLFKAVPGFPDQLESAPQGDGVAILFRGGNANFGFIV